MRAKLGDLELSPLVILLKHEELYSVHVSDPQDFYAHGGC